MSEFIDKVPIHLKMLLTAKESAECSNIGVNNRLTATHAKLPICAVCRNKEVGEAKDF